MKENVNNPMKNRTFINVTKILMKIYYENNVDENILMKKL